MNMVSLEIQVTILAMNNVTTEYRMADIFLVSDGMAPLTILPTEPERPAEIDTFIVYDHSHLCITPDLLRVTTKGQNLVECRE